MDDLTTTQDIEMGFVKFDSFFWKQVRDQLKKQYNSGFEVCLEHPEYVKNILMESFGDSYGFR